MHLDITCPSCKRRLRLEREHIGQEVRCPSCQGKFVADDPTQPLDALPVDDLPEGFAASPRSIPAEERRGPHLGRPRRRFPRPEKVSGEEAALPPGSGGVHGFVHRLAVLVGEKKAPLPAVLAIVLVAVLSVVGIVALASLDQNANRQASRPANWDEEDEALAQPWPVKPVPHRLGLLDDGELRQELAPLFEEMGAALAAQDGRRLTAHLDIPRMVEEAASGEPAFNSLRGNPGFARGVHKGLIRAFNRGQSWSPWVASEIRNIRKLGDDEIVVIARHRDRDNSFLKARWWLTGRSGMWKVYDMEDLDSALRLSFNMGLAVRAAVQAGGLDRRGLARVQEVARATVAVREAFAALAAEDLDTAERKLREADGVQLPARFNAVRLAAQAALQMHRGQAKEVLASVERARRDHPDMPLLLLLAGQAHRHLGQWARAIEQLEAYRRLVGDDPVACQVQGDALRGLSRFQEAAVLYRKALDDNPKDATAFLGLLHALADNDPRDDVPERFARLDDRRENFIHFAEECAKGPDARGLEQIGLAMQKLDPDFAPIDFVLALARAWQSKGAEAARLFRSALERDKNQKYRPVFLPYFLKAMAVGGRATAAYSVLPDAREAFRFLAMRLQENRHLWELKLLVQAHAARHPDDPLLPLYRGEVHVWEGNYPLAEKAFAEGLARRPDRVTLEPFRSARVQARYHGGDPLGAYRDIGPREETFGQLAGLLLADRDHARLQQLLELHAKQAPRSPELLRYRCRLKVRQGKVDEGVALFRSLLAAQANDEQRRQVTTAFLADMVEAGKPVLAYEAAPDAAAALEQLATSLLDDDRLEELRQVLAAHRLRKPGDPLADLHAGQAYLVEEDWKRAAEALTRGWQKASKEQRQRFRWACVRALYRTGQTERALAEIEPRQDTFEQLATMLTGDGKGTELKALVAAQRKQAGEGASLLYHEARAEVLLNQPERAAELFRQACAKETREYQRSSWAYWFVTAMSEAGWPLQAYRAAPDRISAFRAAAPVLLRKKKTRELLRLLAEHGEKHGDDPNRSYQAGELYLLRGDLVQAEHHFLAALGKVEQKQRWLYRNGLHRVRVRMGKTVQTYREPGRATFAELASVCLNSGNAGELAALLEAHRGARPTDQELPGWEVELLWLRKDHAGVCARLLAERSLLASPRWRWKFAGYLVRGLVRQKKTEQAVAQARALCERGQGDRLLLVLAQAAHGDVQQAIAAAQRVHDRQRLYRDEDLGPLLRSEAFAAFRQRFPEAKGPGVERR